jgi:KaiC/GvpD/RAD55 family RecA-like ATPase
VNPIPKELRERDQWVVWRGAQKIPYSPVHGIAAKTTDPATWGTHAEADDKFKRGGFDGIGFVFTSDDPYCGIDLDDCLDESGAPYPRALKLIERFGSYSEVSPSGRGIKIIVRAKKPGPKCKAPIEWAPGAKGQVEIYDTERYFTITGRLSPDGGMEIAQGQANVMALYRQLFPDAAPRVAAAPVTSNVERCWKYLLKCPESISGQNGHDRCLRAACECMRFGLSDGEATGVMERWSAEKSGDEPWSPREIAHKIADARAKCAVEGSIGIRLRNEDWREPAPKAAVKPSAPAPTGHTGELVKLVRRMGKGDYALTEFPRWRTLTNLTQALLPGTVTMLSGSPGAGKTYFLLDMMLGWLEEGTAFSTFMLEEDRTYYLRRSLAMLVGNADYAQVPWIAKNSAVVEAAAIKYQTIQDGLGARIFDAPDKRVTLSDLADWYEEVAGRVRVVIIDPITHADAGKDRFVQDGEFVHRVKTIARKTETSLILATHPSKGRKNGKPTMDDNAGAADYSRFTQCNLYLIARHTDDPVRCKRVLAGQTVTEDTHANRLVQLQKTRNGKGDGLEIAFDFSKESLTFHEKGLVVK